jgi:hypothetical protein
MWVAAHTTRVSGPCPTQRAVRQRAGRERSETKKENAAVPKERSVWVASVLVVAKQLCSGEASGVAECYSVTRIARPRQSTEP